MVWSSDKADHSNTRHFRPQNRYFVRFSDHHSKTDIFGPFEHQACLVFRWLLYHFTFFRLRVRWRKSWPKRSQLLLPIMASEVRYKWELKGKFHQSYCQEVEIKYTVLLRFVPNNFITKTVIVKLTLVDEMVNEKHRCAICPTLSKILLCIKGSIPNFGE